MKIWAVLAMGLSVGSGACGNDAQSSGEEGGGGTNQGTGGSGGDPTAHYFSCEETQFQEAKPLSGPGFDKEQGGIIGTPQETYIVSATQFYVKPDQIDPFFKAAGKVIGELGQTPGSLAFALGQDDGCGVQRTLGIWASEDEMYTFVGGPAHAAAMGAAPQLGFTGKVTHWTVTADELMTLDWDTARAKLEEEDPLGNY